MDGIVTQRLLGGARAAGVKCLVGHRVAKIAEAEGVLLASFSDLGVP